MLRTSEVPSRRAALLIVSGAVVAGGVAGAYALTTRSHRPTSAATVVPSAAPYDSAIARARVAAERERLDQDIAFYARRAEQDPSGGSDLAQLAALYLQRGRQTGDPDQALRAEDAARRALRNRAERNERASQMLAASLVAQHRFGEALDVARALVGAAPEIPAFRALLGEVLLEVGEYEEADRVFDALTSRTREPSVAPRYARWLELSGRAADARALLASTLRAQVAAPNSTVEEIGWYWLRLGDLDLRVGNVDGAGHAYAEALRTRPDDYRALAALARLGAARGNWTEAIDYGERSIAIALDPATLATLSEAHAALGDTAKAEEYARALDVAVLQQPGAYHRAWSLFYLDSGRQVDAVSRKVRAELATRQDVYAHDLMAWALHKQGRPAEARPHVERALARGTGDALIFYHAGAIAHAVGDSAGARRYIDLALRTNPFFQPRAPEAARALLDSLGGPPPASVASPARGDGASRGR